MWLSWVNYSGCQLEDHSNKITDVTGYTTPVVKVYRTWYSWVIHNGRQINTAGDYCVTQGTLPGNTNTAGDYCVTQGTLPGNTKSRECDAAG